jgi:hypothetical protein
MTPSRALAFFLAVAVPFGAADGPPASPEAASGEIGRRVDDYLGRLVTYGFSGAVLIAKDGVVATPARSGSPAVTR